MNFKGNLKHGLRWHSAYPSWNGMMNRCHNPRDPGWKNYGARGIKVCTRWHSVENFVLDMGERPAGFSIERINNNKGYNKANCRWATRREQANNFRRNVNLEFQGKEMSLAEWARHLGINRNTLKKRWRLGWAVERILGSLPLK